MAKKLYEEASVQDIAAAIREKTGGAETYKIAQMGDAVRGITTGAHDAYNRGDKVNYNGKHYIRTADANVYAPGVYGWEAED